MADQGTEGLLSPFLRWRRFAAAKPYLKGRVLDVGCGSGALAEWVMPDLYWGVEIDELSLARARNRYPSHRFESHLPKHTEKFDSIAALAVIEHVTDPSAFLKELAEYLVQSPDSRIFITTPHPSTDWIHAAGARLGLFSKHANEEHEELLDEMKMLTNSEHAGLFMIRYERFLFGANQLAVFRKGA